MSKEDHVKETLARTERDLLVLLSEAAKQGDYEAIERTRAAAQAVRLLLDRLTPPSPVAIHKLQSTNRQEPPGRSPHVPVARGRLPVSGGYPRFTIEGDVLTKTAWSKRDRREYDQKAWHADYGRVVSAMADLVSKGRGPFTAHEIQSRLQEEGGEKLPDYKLYVALSFLKNEGIIHQVGRGGYQFDRGIAARAERSWEILAGRGGLESTAESTEERSA